MHTHFKLLCAGLAMALALSACVTINIYFPEAAAEKAADKIIDDVWQLNGGKPEQPASPSEPAPTSGQE